MEESLTNSSDLEERKLKRKFRIQHRFEDSHTKTSIEDESILDESIIRKQLLESSEILNKLLSEGDEVITCVKIANDAREVYRRKEETENRKKLLMKLENEDEKCTTLYRDIVKHWPNIIACNDPLSIHTEIKLQYERCSEVLSKKDSLIAKLREELENADSRYEEDQKNQTDDITHLIERIENQFAIMINGYRRELLFINKAVDEERRILLETVKDKWNDLYEKIRAFDWEGMEKRKDIMRTYEVTIEKIIEEHQEGFRAERIKLENEIDDLQREVQRMKAVCLTNVQKLEYSYSILKCREEENIMIRSHQKRKINESLLRNVVKNLNQEYSNLEQSMETEVKRLSEQILKSCKSITELEKKSSYFKRINHKRYFDIWNINIESANELLEKILFADRVVHEKVLGLEWHKPEIKYPFSTSQIHRASLYRKVKSSENLNEKSLELDAKNVPDKCYEGTDDLKEINAIRQILNHIMRLISDETGYLIENDFRKLLVPYTTHENTIIRLDDIFKALNINSKEEIYLMLNFFLPYAYCPICKAALEEDKSASDLMNSDDTSTSIVESSSSSITSESNSKEKMKSYFASSEACKVVNENLQLLCEKKHMLQIQRSKVTKALKEFIGRYKNIGQNIPSSADEKTETCHELVSQRSSVPDIAIFWQQYREVFSTKKEYFWSILLTCLQKYYKILKDRYELNNENKCLAKQNAELEQLLKTYLRSTKSEDCKSSEKLTLSGHTIT